MYFLYFFNFGLLCICNHLTQNHFLGLKNWNNFSLAGKIALYWKTQKKSPLKKNCVGHSFIATFIACLVMSLPRRLFPRSNHLWKRVGNGISFKHFCSCFPCDFAGEFVLYFSCLCGYIWVFAWLQNKEILGETLGPFVNAIHVPIRIRFWIRIHSTVFIRSGPFSKPIIFRTKGHPNSSTVLYTWYFGAWLRIRIRTDPL